MKTIQAQKGDINKADGYVAREAILTELPAPQDMACLKPLYEAALTAAEEAGAETAYFPPIPAADLNSTMFQAITLIYQTMRKFQASHTNPRRICILCDDDRVLQLYMVVWNLYYAEDKADRMNDGRWD